MNYCAKIVQSERRTKQIYLILRFRTAAYLLKTKFIFQSPNLLPTASAGRSLIDVRVGILQAETPLYGDLLRPLWHSRLNNAPPTALSSTTHLSTVVWLTLTPLRFIVPEICSGGHWSTIRCCRHSNLTFGEMVAFFTMRPVPAPSHCAYPPFLLQLRLSSR